MKSASIVCIFIFVLIATTITGCGGGEPLTYDMAMDLMRERKDVVRITFSAAPQFSKADERLEVAYQKLLNGKIIQCKNTSMGALCEPGAAGDELSQPSPTELTMIAGRWVPSSVLSLHRFSRNSANADIRMSFEPGQTFREFGDALDIIQPPGYLVALSSHKEGKVVHVSFQHFDDGWHVESVSD